MENSYIDEATKHSHLIFTLWNVVIWLLNTYDTFHWPILLQCPLIKSLPKHIHDRTSVNDLRTQMMYEPSRSAVT